MIKYHAVVEFDFFGDRQLSNAMSNIEFSLRKLDSGEGGVDIRKISLSMIKEEEKK